MSEAKRQDSPAGRPGWKTVRHPVTGRTITYAVARVRGKKVVLIKRK